MSFWHGIVILLIIAAVIGVPLFLIYLAVRAGVRSGMKGRGSPPDGGN